MMWSGDSWLLEALDAAARRYATVSARAARRLRRRAARARQQRPPARRESPALPRSVESVEGSGEAGEPTRPSGHSEACDGEAGLPPCFICRRRRFWRSISGPVVCAWCHPPADPGLVAEWIERGLPLRRLDELVDEPGTDGPPLGPAPA
jgi:hypothetical protein